MNHYYVGFVYEPRVYRLKAFFIIMIYEWFDSENGPVYA